MGDRLVWHLLSALDPDFPQLFKVQADFEDARITSYNVCYTKLLRYPSFGNLAPRDIASRAAKEQCDDGRGVGPGGRGVYLDFAASINRLGQEKIEERYGNLFQMYEKITDENAYKQPMRIFPAPHYSMSYNFV